MFILNTRALVSVLVFLSYPALASPIAPMDRPSGDVVKVVCAEGSKNCLPKDAQHTKIGNELNEQAKSNPGNDQECKGGGTCGVPNAVKNKQAGSVGGTQHSGVRH
jgi:hypothetical protein